MQLYIMPNTTRDRYPPCIMIIEMKLIFLVAESLCRVQPHNVAALLWQIWHHIMLLKAATVFCEVQEVFIDCKNVSKKGFVFFFFHVLTMAMSIL